MDRRYRGFASSPSHLRWFTCLASFNICALFLAMQTKFNPALIKSILDKMGRDDRYTHQSMATLTFDELYEKLSETEAKIIKALLELKPEALGFLGPFVSMDGPPANLVAIKGQAFTRDGKVEEITAKHLPGPVWKAFQKMQKAIKTEIGSNLMVESGYRSPAHQAIVFLTYLELFKFDIKYVASGVALPGYSQHGDPFNTALDVINQDGIPTDEYPEFFAETKEYAWLIKNADKYGFHLSYPKDNPYGVKYEPWHWQFKG